MRAQLLQVVGPRDAKEGLEVLHRPVVRELLSFSRVLCLKEAVLQQKHRSQVCTGTLTHQHHIGGVTAIAFDVLEDPSNPTAHILHHVRDATPWEVAVVHSNSHDAKLHESQAQLGIVATMSDDEGTTHDGHHHRNFRTFLQRLLGNINVQVFPLRRSVTDPAMNAGIMVIGQHDANESWQQHGSIEAQAEAQPTGCEAELKPPNAADGQINAVNQEVEVIRNDREVAITPGLQVIVEPDHFGSDALTFGIRLVDGRLLAFLRGFVSLRDGEHQQLIGFL
mmetsp:Transcript_1199/g.2689  ORF Transcript_1199/g.2689 Transcript_1199/m.2689 type:complete len:280 (-) Transcript_1199:138-977(-)